MQKENEEYREGWEDGVWGRKERSVERKKGEFIKNVFRKMFKCNLRETVEYRDWDDIFSSLKKNGCMISLDN